MTSEDFEYGRAHSKLNADLIPEEAFELGRAHPLDASLLSDDVCVAVAAMLVDAETGS